MVNILPIEESAYYNDEVTVQKKYDSISKTNYMITKVSHKDANGNIIKLKRGFANDNSAVRSGETARSFANRNIATLAINASVFGDNFNLRGHIIHEGSVLLNTAGMSGLHILGIKADNTLVSYPPDTAISTMLADGCVETVIGFEPIVKNGVKIDSPREVSNHPRQVIGQLPNKDIIILTCDGRTATDLGMNMSDCSRIMLAEGATFAYNLDGGGSNQTVLRGRTLNRVYDEGGTKERLVPDFLYFGKEYDMNNLDIAAVAKDIGDVSFKVDQINAKLGTSVGNLPASIDDDFAVNRPTNLNNIKKTGLYWTTAATTNAPPTPAISWGIMHYQYSATQAQQIAFPYHEKNGVTQTRRADGLGGWHAWRPA